MGWSEQAVCRREIRDAHKILVGKPEGRKPLGRPGCRLEDIIKIDLRKIEWEVVDLIRSSGSG
jgi:hypothetical protein